ncbi:MAG: GNAT family N-acetyltransferase [Myxococcales bacterium]|nr:GNAT family N-acetyltransferase [Myxococcales bacterium]
MTRVELRYEVFARRHGEIHSGTPVSAEEFRDVLRRSTLGARRPVDDLPRLGRMLDNSNLIVTAREPVRSLLIGISRCVTDFAYCCYCSDLAVDEAVQRQGVGRELLRLTREAAGDDATLLLVAAPNARDYYPRIGMHHVDRCFAWPRSG